MPYSPNDNCVSSTSAQASANHSIYLPGLNGVRAIAAVGVAVSHSLMALNLFGMKKMRALEFAGSGVTVFFTLSGFLITYLLLIEKEKTNAIDFKKFYLRRILRIWPLYFIYLSLVLIVQFYVANDLAANIGIIILYIFFLPNIAFNLNRSLNSASHLWSIGIEEQFYAFWPFILSRVKHLKKFLVWFIIAVIIIRIGLKVLSIYLHNTLPFSIIACMRFDCMAIGAFFALAYYNKDAFILKVSQSLITDIVFWGFVTLAVFYKISFFSLLTDDVVSGITGFFILGQITKSDKTTLLENPVMGFLGQISYGIYVYHVLIISILSWVYTKYSLRAINSSICVCAIISLTIFIAYLSYTFIEKPFLKLKDKFAVVKSGK